MDSFPQHQLCALLVFKDVMNVMDGQLVENAKKAGSRLKTEAALTLGLKTFLVITWSSARNLLKTVKCGSQKIALKDFQKPHLSMKLAGTLSSRTTQSQNICLSSTDILVSFKMANLSSISFSKRNSRASQWDSILDSTASNGQIVYTENIQLS
jgi:hypothetical protein